MLLDLDKLSDVMVTAVDPALKSMSEKLNKRIELLELALGKVVDHSTELMVKANALEAIGRRHDDTERRLSLLEERQVENGKDGKDGKDGERGEKGEKGEKGEAGQPGEKGDPGQKGDSGDKGEQGEPGKNGVDGTNGKDGQPGKDGRDGTDADPHEIAAILQPAIEAALPEMTQKAVARLLPGLVEKAVAEVPVIHGRDGRDGQPGGPPGPQGPQGPPGKDGASVEYSGTWDRERSYTKGSLVTWDGSMWHCKHETAGEVPGRTDAWQLAVKKGTPGRDGAPGPAGKDGAPGRPGRDLVHPGSIV